MLNRNIARTLVHKRWIATGQSMNAWVCDEYKKPLVARHVAIPVVKEQNQVLVKTASVNPIDVRMTEGYANEAMIALHRLQNREFTDSSYHRLPLITGRDLCGEIVQIGSGVQNIKVGDKVIGVVPAWWQGSHAECVMTNNDCVSLKPFNIDAVNATASVYTFATVWSALKLARIPTRNASNLRILIHGGSGGIGTAAIQLLRQWHARKIVATASEKNLQLIKDLGAIPVDYNSPQAKEELTKHAPFDLILDCAQSPLTQWSDSLLGTWRGCTHLSLVSPLVSNMDRHGLPLGLATTAVQLLCRNIENFKRGQLFMYAFFWPDKEAMDHLSTMLEEGNLKPVIEKVYSFNELPHAYAQVGQMHSRGKHVIDFNKHLSPPAV